MQACAAAAAAAAAGPRHVVARVRDPRACAVAAALQALQRHPRALAVLLFCLFTVAVGAGVG